MNAVDEAKKERDRLDAAASKRNKELCMAMLKELIAVVKIKAHKKEACNLERYKVIFSAMKTTSENYGI